jgi:hypothetical protein
MRDDLPMVIEAFPNRFRRLCADAKLPKTRAALGKALGVSGPFSWMGVGKSLAK